MPSRPYNVQPIPKETAGLRHLVSQCRTKKEYNILSGGVPLPHGGLAGIVGNISSTFASPSKRQGVSDGMTHLGIPPQSSSPNGRKPTMSRLQLERRPKTHH